MTDARESAPQELPRYELSLRAIGAYLDDHNAAEFHLLEVPQGFALRYQLSHNEFDPKIAFFSFDSLKVSRSQSEWTRKVRRLPTESGRNYENLLRAVGFELDQSRAMCILLEELPDSLMISYEFDDPARGFLLRKRMAIAGPRDRERLLNDLRSRRRRFHPPASIPRWQPGPEPQWAGLHD